MSTVIQPNSIIGCSARNPAHVSSSATHVAYISGSFVAVSALASVHKGEVGQFLPLQHQLVFPIPAVTLDLHSSSTFLAVAEKCGKISVLDLKREEVASSLETGKSWTFLRLVGSSLLLGVTVDEIFCFDWRAKRKLATSSLDGRRVLAISRGCAEHAVFFVTGVRGFARLANFRRARSAVLEMKVLQSFTSDNLASCGLNESALVAGSCRGVVFVISRDTLTVNKTINFNKPLHSIDVLSEILAAGCADGEVKLLDLRTKSEISSFRAHPEADSAAVLCVRLLGNSPFSVLSLYSDNSLILWRQNAPHLYVFGRQGELVSSCVLSRDLLAVVSEDVLSIWSVGVSFSLVQAAPLADFIGKSAHPRGIFALDASHVAIWWSDASLSLLDRTTLRVKTVFRASSEICAVSGASEFLAVAEASGRVVLLDESLTLVSSYEKDSEDFVASEILLCPGRDTGRRVVLWSRSARKLKIVNFPSLEVSGFCETEHSHVEISSCCLSPDGDAVICADTSDGLFRLSLAGTGPATAELDFLAKLQGGWLLGRTLFLKCLSDTVAVAVAVDVTVETSGTLGSDGHAVLAVVEVGTGKILDKFRFPATAGEVVDVQIVGRPAQAAVLLRSGQILGFNLQPYTGSHFSPPPHAQHWTAAEAAAVAGGRLSLAKQPRWSTTQDDAALILPTPPSKRSQWHRESQVGRPVREIPVRVPEPASQASAQLLETVGEAERALTAVQRLQRDENFSLDVCSAEETRALERLRVQAEEVAIWLRSQLYLRHPKLGSDIKSYQ